MLRGDCHVNLVVESPPDRRSPTWRALSGLPSKRSLIREPRTDVFRRLTAVMYSASIRFTATWSGKSSLSSDSLGCRTVLYYVDVNINNATTRTFRALNKRPQENIWRLLVYAG